MDVEQFEYAIANYDTISPTGVLRLAKAAQALHKEAATLRAQLTARAKWDALPKEDRLTVLECLTNEAEGYSDENGAFATAIKALEGETE